MDTSAPKSLFLFLLTSIFIVCSTGALLSPVTYTKRQQLQREEQTFHSTSKIQHDFVNFPTTTPVTTPPTVTVSPATSTPAVVTVPSATPVTVTPTPPSTPVPVPPTTPTTNPTNPPVPVTTPSTNTPPVTNPVTTPAVAPPGAGNAPAVPGQSWCVAKTGTPEKTLQAALDYACGIGGADCSGIQQGASCYNPNTLQNHASYAFNSYYQHNPVPTSCDFGGAATVTNANPSSGSCMFTTSSSSTPPTTASPITTTPTPTTPMTPSTPTTPAYSTGAAPTGSSSGTPPTIMNASYPALGGATTGFGDSPPIANMTSSVSLSSRCLQPFILLVASVITGGIVLDI